MEIFLRPQAKGDCWRTPHRGKHPRTARKAGGKRSRRVAHREGGTATPARARHKGDHDRVRADEPNGSRAWTTRNPDAHRRCPLQGRDNLRSAIAEARSLRASLLLSPHPEEPAKRASRRMAADSAERLAILRDAATQVGFSRLARLSADLG